jgi:acyl-CoA synthetase (AMP-forming)/AMP-acid ligase II
MAGYWNAPEASAATLRDGWLDTGDLGYLAQGELFLTGRSKAVLIRAGRKHHAADLERAAEAVPGIRRGCSAAFPVEDPAGEEIVLVVERSAAAAAGGPALARQVVAAVARGEGVRPDRVVLAAPRAVPKTTSGKVQRPECKRLLVEGTLRLAGPFPED